MKRRRVLKAPSAPMIKSLWWVSSFWVFTLQ
jgi:hypothetical protein